ncbi:tripartite-type tricarboxylate transporter receptor subunit TctC [Cupriavidus gilardii J11]|uniref:Tripartite-type tricarboxylate transporter receptor subunit TctC n=1 Tax=Cupriavidus gilardii J11 TaxID=936133 RepID=A0A562BQM4_9BURK|nr:tripartite-type tricarboxylate transporter receptor subunit TctC [Cupriavidus gilardii J11]
MEETALQYKTTFSTLACAALAGILAASPVAAQTYPDQPVQVLVGWSAGGIIDATARAFARSISEVSGANFVVMNREGASGMIGAQLVARAKPDGYTIGFGPITPIAAVSYTMRHPGYGAKDFQYICKVYDNVFTVMVPAESPYKTIQELIADIKAKPGKLSYGHFGPNSLGNMVGRNLLDTLQLQAVEVPYKGEAPIYPELMARRLDFAIGTLNGSRGKPVRILGVVANERVPGIDAPTLKEAGLPSLDPAQVGVFAPKGVSAQVKARLGELCRKTVESESFKAQMSTLQQQITYRDQDAFTKLAMDSFAAQIAQAKKMDIKPE